MATSTLTRPSPARLLLDWLPRQTEMQWVREPVGDGRQSLQITRLTSRISLPGEGQVRLARVRARDGALAGVKMAVKGAGQASFQDVPITSSEDAVLALRTFDAIELGLGVNAGSVTSGANAEWRRAREEHWSAGLGLES